MWATHKLLFVEGLQESFSLTHLTERRTGGEQRAKKLSEVPKVLESWTAEMMVRTQDFDSQTTTFSNN